MSIQNAKQHQLYKEEVFERTTLLSSPYSHKDIP